MRKKYDRGLSLVILSQKNCRWIQYVQNLHILLKTEKHKICMTGGCPLSYSRVKRKKLIF